jgi:hypothetical protein
VNLSTGGRGGEESSNRRGRRGTHRTGGVMSDSRRLAGGSAARAIRFNDKLAGPPEPTHCQNGSRRRVHKSGVIFKIMRVLWPWTHLDTDSPMTLYETNSCAHTETCVHLRPVCPNTTPIRGVIRLQCDPLPAPANAAPLRLCRRRRRVFMLR